MAEKKEQVAYVLPADASTSSEPQHFGVFPGLFTPGVPVALADLELSPDRAAALVKEHNLPLEKTTAKPPEPDEPSASAAAPEKAEG